MLVDVLLKNRWSLCIQLYTQIKRFFVKFRINLNLRMVIRYILKQWTFWNNRQEINAEMSANIFANNFVRLGLSNEDYINLLWKDIAAVVWLCLVRQIPNTCVGERPRMNFIQRRAIDPKPTTQLLQLDYN